LVPGPAGAEIWNTQADMERRYLGLEWCLCATQPVGRAADLVAEKNEATQIDIPDAEQFGRARWRDGHRVRTVADRCWWRLVPVDGRRQQNTPHLHQHAWRPCVDIPAKGRRRKRPPQRVGAACKSLAGVVGRARVYKYGPPRDWCTGRSAPFELNEHSATKRPARHVLNGDDATTSWRVK